MAAIRSQAQTRANAAHLDWVELSSAYPCLPNRLQVLETPEATPVNPKLESLYTKAKEEMADSYADNIGGFCQEMGPSGVFEDMWESATENSFNKITPTDRA